MIINGIELRDLDVADADEMEIYENEVAKFTNDDDMSGLTRSQAIRHQCQKVFDCFNNIFGEGTANKLFGNKTNLVVCVDAFEQLVTWVKDSDHEIAQKYRQKSGFYKNNVNNYKNRRNKHR